MLIFEYRHWAGWGIGSSATFSADILSWYLQFTLRTRDGKSALLDVEQVAPEHAYDKPLGRPSDIILYADPAAAPAPSRKRKTRTPVEKIVQPPKEPDAAPFKTVAEGDEVVDAVGEEYLCRWFESRGSLYGQEQIVKTWISEKVPGGIVRVERKFPNLGGIPSTWILMSFEGK